MESLKFEDLNITPEIKKALEAMEYNEMTPIQEASLPTILEGKDVIAQAPTGTGKTCCFAVSSINLVDPDNDEVQVLVLCPTRELAMQVTNEIRLTGQFTEGVRSLTIYGGQSIDIQIRGLKKRPQIIVGTPGRIMDHMRRGTLKLDHIRLLILDEADEMLDMGFREDLDVILADAQSERQTLLFSATMPKPIIEISEKYQKDAVNIKTTYHDLAIPSIDQYYVELRESNKEDCLCRMIDTYNFKQALVFCRTKKKVDDLSFSMSSRGYQVDALHGDLKQTGRDKVMEKFRKGISNVLIATDVAARGLDIEGIDVIFNYDLPEETEYYVHRIGRTARAGRTGSAYTFVTKGEISKIKEFEQFTKTKIERILPPSYEMSEIKKVTHRLDEIKQYIAEKDLTAYINYIETAIAEDQSELQPIQYAAALLMQEIRNESEIKDSGLDITEDFSKSRRKIDMPEGYVRLFLNIGRMDNLEKRDLIDMFSQELGISRDDVRGVDVLNTFSFVAIPGDKQENAIKAFNGEYINDRRIAIEVSDPENGEKHERKREPKSRPVKSFRDRPSYAGESRRVWKPREQEEPVQHDYVEEDPGSVKAEEPRRTYKPKTADFARPFRPRAKDTEAKPFHEGNAHARTAGFHADDHSRPYRGERDQANDNPRARKPRPMMDYSFGSEGGSDSRRTSGRTHRSFESGRDSRPAFRTDYNRKPTHFGEHDRTRKLRQK